MTASRTRRLASLALAAMPIALLGGIAAAPAQASAEASGPSDAHGGRYVALGDSYASGFGLEPYSTLPVLGCFQSEIDYPHRVAEALELQLTDVSCTGAVTANLIDTPQRTPFGVLAPVQADSLSPRTEIVTVNIGGNDLGFSDVLPQCLAASPVGPLLGAPGVPNCEAVLAPGGNDSLALKLQHEVVPALHRTLEVIAEKAPYATVHVVGYPSIFPSPEDTPEGGCFVDAIGSGTAPFPENAFPFTEVDTAYFHRTQAALDSAIADVAAEHGATFVSTMAESAGHEPCASNPDAWVSGITFTSLAPPTTALGGLHPNEAGVAFLAERVTTAVAGR